jgi:putative DNA primase/helicase
MAKSLDDVMAQMRGYGLDVPLSVDLNKAFHGYLRWRPQSEIKHKKSAWARLYSWRSPTTQVEYITGAFGWRGETWHVESSSGDWSPAERAAELEARKAAAKAAEAERAKDAQAAAAKAQTMWDRGLDADKTGQHEYLARKKVGAFGLRVAFKRLLVPLRDTSGKLHGLQYIDPDGAKIFGTGTIKEGQFHLIGDVLPDVPIAFGEGYATCATGHMATGWPVVTCFDAGNLEPVVAAWRKLYPDHQFVILADDDRHIIQRLADRLFKLGLSVPVSELKPPVDRTWEVPEGPTVICKAAWKPDSNGGPMRLEGSISVNGQLQMLKLENAGMAKAALAAKKHKGMVLPPAFATPQHPGTDWNDLHCDVGLQATREALLKAFEAPPPAEKKRANGAPAGVAMAARLESPQSEGMTFFERYTLIYGTTTVWDAHQREIIRLEALKVAYGKLVDTWLASDQRNMVPQSHVVFDPTGQAKLPTHINLFDRLPLDPKRDGVCDRIVQHIYNLCDDRHELAHWVMCWLAYPLQNPGAKMRTSLIVFGRTEGTGKSKLSDLVRRIYGRYARTITQRQMESEFNGWQSSMLMCVAEEVVSRADRAQLQGLIQNMITNETIQINEKNLPLRQERNSTNFIFHSNAQVPMLLNDTDRRFTVIKVEQEQGPAYFQALDEESDNGGVEAFLHYLLTYDLGSFNEHTRPMENPERLQLITLGMSPDRRFMEFWTKGHIDLPFCSAPACDLYMAFQVWCRSNGERFVPNSTAFGTTAGEVLRKLGAPEKKKVRWEGYSAKAIESGPDDDDITQTYQSIVYFVSQAVKDKCQPPVSVVTDAPPAPPENCTEREVYNKAIKIFQHGLSKLIGSNRRAY